jgi:hypothetical protein
MRRDKVELEAFLDCVSSSLNGAKKAFLDFDFTSEDRLDTFFFENMGTAPEYAKIWRELKRLLIQSHGQASVEREDSLLIDK